MNQNPTSNCAIGMNYSEVKHIVVCDELASTFARRLEDICLTRAVMRNAKRG